MKKGIKIIFLIAFISFLFGIDANAQSMNTYTVIDNPDNVSLNFLDQLSPKQLDFIRIRDERAKITIANHNVTIELLSVDELEAKNIAVDRNRSIKGSLWTIDTDYKSVKRIYSLDDGQLIDKTNYKK